MKCMCKFQDWYRQPRKCRVPLPKQWKPQRQRGASEVDRIPITFDKKNLSVELHWHILQSVPCLYWMKQLFIYKTTFMVVLLKLSIFWLCPGLKITFLDNSVCKNLFLSACLCWHSRLSLREMDRKFSLVETLVQVNCFWSTYCVNSQHLNYTQIFMMLLKQCRHIVAKFHTTVAWLDSDQTYICFFAPNV